MIINHEERPRTGLVSQGRVQTPADERRGRGCSWPVAATAGCPPPTLPWAGSRLTPHQESPLPHLEQGRCSGGSESQPLLPPARGPRTGCSPRRSSSPRPRKADSGGLADGGHGGAGELLPAALSGAGARQQRGAGLQGAGAAAGAAARHGDPWHGFRARRRADGASAAPLAGGEQTC